MTSVAAAIKYGIDTGYAAVSLLGHYKFQCWLVTITTISGVRTRTNTRLTVGDHVQYPNGFSIYAQTSDGYLNASVGLVTAREAFLSNNRLTDKDYVLGPLVYPYNTGYTTGGFDLQRFDPANPANNNTAIYLWVKDPSGNSLPASGIYCKMKYHEDDSNYRYYVYWENTGGLVAP